MAEQERTEMLSSLMGQDALQMLGRMERLKKLMGTMERKEMPLPSERTDIFCRSRQEDMISAAIPFLDRAYQKEIYIMVRLMEMQRILQSSRLEVREKQETASVRRQKMMQAVGQYLPEAERTQMENLMKLMMVREIMGQEEKK